MLKPLFSIGTFVISFPSNIKLPFSISVIPNIRLRSVVLPLPEGPNIETISPLFMEREMFLRITFFPKDFLMFFNSSIFTSVCFASRYKLHYIFQNMFKQANPG